jgi:hypothetical protein
MHYWVVATTAVSLSSVASHGRHCPPDAREAEAALAAM